ncbi:MAG TPA: hypothetical protein VF008_31685 [Niastella sp.]
MSQEQSIASYLSSAQSLFNILKQDYQDNGNPRVFMGSTNYWMAGNVFDTTLDYMLLAMHNNIITPQEVDGVMAYVAKNYDLAFQSYNATYNYYTNDNGTQGGPTSQNPAEPNGFWYDDYGWWGIASAKVYAPEYQNIFRNYVSQYKSLAGACWHVMNNGFQVDPNRPIQWGAPNVWAKCDKTKFGQYEPRVNGGVWQCDMNDQYDPGTAVLGPFQNTVVNGLYLVLALRMDKAINTTTQIAREYQFLTTWCFDSSIPTVDQLYYSFGTNTGLVLERVATYKNGQPVQPVEWREQHCAWCGDQGLILGAMVDYLNLQPGAVPARNLIVGILQGVASHMQLNSILSPWYPLTSDNPLKEADAPDYASGIGVYMRYLLYAYNNNATVQQMVNANTAGIKDMIISAANACVNGTFPKYHNGIFDLFNQLSTLITAATILRGAEKAEASETAEVDSSAN